MILSGIFDKNGKEVKKGDLLHLPQVVEGEITDYMDIKVKVVFEHGCFGYYDEGNFCPLFVWSKKRRTGDFVIIKDVYPFEVI